jgi:hypothetical protein
MGVIRFFLDWKVLAIQVKAHHFDAGFLTKIQGTYDKH